MPGLEVGLGMSSAFYDWVRGFFERDFQRKNGAIIAADFNYRESSRREFQDALITEVSFPTLDVAARDPAFLTVKLQPESTQFKPGSGATVTPPISSKAKKWTVSNFGVELSGLESATQRVSKVDGFAIKMKVAEEQGEIRPADVADRDLLWIYYDFVEGTAADVVDFREIRRAAQS